MAAGTFSLVGGQVCNGSRSAPVRADVVVTGDQIVAVGNNVATGRRIDVRDLVVAPGFVDIHSHADWVAPLPESVDLLSVLGRQGITTTVGGNCGTSAAPILRIPPEGAIEQTLGIDLVAGRVDWRWRSVADYASHLESNSHLPVNLAMFVGHNTIRAQVVGEAARSATPSELRRMSQLISDGYVQGAAGLSFGFEYFPGRHAGTDEAAALAASMPGGVVALHTRGLSELYTSGMEEAIEIGARSGKRIQLSHVNPLGRAFREEWHRLPEIVAAARKRGVEVGWDAVVFTVWENDWPGLFPYTVSGPLGRDGMLSLMRSAPGRAHLRTLLNQHARWPSWPLGEITKNPLQDVGWRDLILAKTTALRYASGVGRSVAEIADSDGRDAFDVFCDMVAQDPLDTRFLNAWVTGDLEDDSPMAELLRLDDLMPETDAFPDAGPLGEVRVDMPHWHGTMPRFLGRYCRELGLMPIQDAVWRMSGLPADWLGLRDRGHLRAGAIADIVVFDPLSVGDRGTALQAEPPAGIEWVFVNGQALVQQGALHPIPAGRFVGPTRLEATPGRR